MLSCCYFEIRDGRNICTTEIGMRYKSGLFSYQLASLLQLAHSPMLSTWQVLGKCVLRETFHLPPVPLLVLDPPVLPMAEALFIPVDPLQHIHAPQMPALEKPSREAGSFPAGPRSPFYLSSRERCQSYPREQS